MVSFDFSKPTDKKGALSLFATSAGASNSFAPRGEVIKNALLSVKAGSKIAKSENKKQRKLAAELEDSNNGFKKRFKTKVEKLIKSAEKKKESSKSERDEKDIESSERESGHKRSHEAAAKESQNSLAYKKRKESEEKRQKKESIAEREESDREKGERTIFVGNVPVTMTKKELMKLFKKFGAVESTRFRSVAIENIKVPKRGAVITGQFRNTRDSMNAYVVFKEGTSVMEAVKEMNGFELEGKHLRVDRVGHGAKNTNPRLSIFVGNLSFEAEEEALRSHFAASCPGVTSVRIVRDKATNIGKGFAYVAFANVDGVTAALKLHDTPFMNRNLRVSRSSNPKSPDAPSNKEGFRLKRGGKKILTGEESHGQEKGPLTPEEIKRRKKEKRKVARETGTSARAQRRAAFNKK